MQAWVVIDRRGGLGTASVSSVIRRLNGAMNEQQLIDYLVVNCGHGALRLRHQDMHIRLRPDQIAAPALGELFYRIHDMPWRRMAANLFVEGAWRHEILPSHRDEAIRRISRIVAQAKYRRDNAVLRRARSLKSIPPRSALNRVLQAWRRRPELSSSNAPRGGLLDEVRRRYVWVDTHAHNSELVLTEVGTGFPEPVRGTLVLGLGYRLQQQADLAYGQYCLDAYGQVAQSGVPLLEDVDAIIVPPNGHRVRRRYSRLILPFRSPRGNVRLLGISLEDLSIDLRRAG